MADQEPTTPPRLRQADPSHDFYVYHLLDEDGTPFYAGCTKHPGRYAAHLKFARKELARNSQVEKNEIIVRMLDAGLTPGFRKIAEGLSQDEGHALERAEIARLGNHDGGAQGGSNRLAAAQARSPAGGWKPRNALSGSSRAGTQRPLGNQESSGNRIGSPPGQSRPPSLGAMPTGEVCT